MRFADRAGKTPEIGGTAQPAIAQVTTVEDERRIREGLEAAFRSMEDALAQPRSVVPDVFLVDIGLPGMSGLEGLGVLRERYPSAALVMLTVYEDDERIFDAGWAAHAHVSGRLAGPRQTG